MKYTSSQLDAIKTSGQNILVSASAGSGKTGVLKERVIEIVKSGVDIDKLIVLTFTKAAAEEMKTRILKELENNSLDEQIAKADNAIISTFDAFSLRLVSEYHYLLDLDKDIFISDSVLIKIRKQEIINDVIKDYYQKDSSSFNELFKLYFQKSDNWLYQAIYNIGQSFRKLPNYQNRIDNYFNYYQTPDFIKEMANLYLDNVKTEVQQLFNDFQSLYMENLNHPDERINSYLKEITEVVVSILEKTKANDFISAINNHSFPRKPAIKEFDKPEIIGEIKTFKTSFDKMFITDFNSLEESLVSIKPSVDIILEITKEYLEKFSQFQKEEKLYSFEDIMFFSIELLEKFPDIKVKYQNNISEILIDEYQDTNDLQDYFISLISNDNVFMVGDVKQSIYRFRDANPKNFLRIYHDYLSSRGGKAIFLQENFRSNKYVLAEVNKIFKKIMSNDTGGIDYIDEQVLVSGYPDDFGLHKKSCFNMITYNKAALLEKYPDLTRAEIEAHFTALNIKKRIDNHELIYDLKQKKMRQVEYQDMTILVDRKTQFSQYAKIIASYNIPIEIFSDEPFFLSDEIQFITQFLILLNCFKDQEYFNKYFKTAFYACSRSFVYQVKDQVIIDFLVLENIKSVEDLTVLSKYKELNKLYNDLLIILKDIDLLPLGGIIAKIYQLLNIYQRIAFLDNPAQKEEKLDFFLLKVRSFKDFLFIDLIKYLENINENSDLDIEYSQSKNNINAIKLMSIHKSKGLQFPICYLIGLSKQFNNSENKENFIFNKNTGILTKSYKNGFYRNFLQDMLFTEIEKENISEKIRLFYVALTRTINSLCLVVEYDEALVLNKPKKILSFKHLLYKVYDFSNIEISELDIPKRSDDYKSLTSTNEVITYKKFSFNKQEKLESHYSKSMNSFLDDDIIKMIDYGNYYHQLIEKIDYNSIDTSIENYPDDLKKSITHLTNTNLFKSFKNPLYYQEYEFYQEKDNQIKRGIIDLLVIDDLYITIIDFKLKNINDLAYESQLKGYYDFLKDKLKKPFRLYLYSIMNRDLKKVEL